MPTRQQLETALINADKAGDTAAAQALAGALKSGAYSETQQQPQQPEQGFLGKAADFAVDAVKGAGNALVGGLEAGATIASGVGAEPVAGLAGIAAAPFVGAENAGDVVNKVREWGTYQPQTQKGQEYIGNVGGALEPVGRELEGTEKMLGDAAMNLTGSPAVAAAASAVPTALMEGMGLAGAKAATKVRPGTMIEGSTGKLPENVKSMFKKPNDEKAALIQAIEKNDNPMQAKAFSEAAEQARKIGDITADDIGRAGKTVVNGKLVTEKPAKELIRQGMDPGTVALIQSSGKADKQAYGRALDILKAAKRSKTVAVPNRPGDVAGDILKSRYDVVSRINKRAGGEINKAAEKLAGKNIDIQGAYGEFIDGLNDLGVSIRRGKNGKLEGGYDGSEFELSKTSQKVLNNFIAKSEKGTVDALDAHRLKRVIDSSVEYGKKNSKPMLAKSESLLKGLRGNINSTLQELSPEYKKANTTFAETRGAMDEFQQAAGPSFNPNSANADKQLVNTVRSIMSNNQKRVPAIDSINSLQEVAIKYGESFDDDILKQAAFMNDLETLFGSSAPTSFGGQIEKAVGQAVRGDTVGLALEAGKEGVKRVRGINEENLIKALEKILGDTK